MIFIAVLIFYVQNRNLLSPSLIVAVVFTISALFFGLYASTWHSVINFRTALILIIGILSIALGEILSRLIYRINADKILSQSSIIVAKRDKDPIYISNIQMTMIALLMMSMAFYVYISVRNVSMATGGSGDISVMLNDARYVIVSGIGSIGTIAIILNILAKSFFAIFAFILIYNAIICGEKLRNVINIIPIVLYIPFIILTTGRTEFIYIVVYMIVVSGMMSYIKKGSINRANKKISIIALLGFAVFVGAFMLLGAMSGKSQSLGLSAVPIYTGSSLPAFNEYIDSSGNNNSSLFGEHTLYGVYSLLNKADSKIPMVTIPLEFIYFNDGKTNTNVYTMFRRYIQDYTLFGMFIISFFIGYMYTTLMYRAMDLSKHTYLRIIIYALICYPLFESSIEERLLMNVFSPATLLLCAFVVILYYVFINKKISNARRRDAQV